MERIINIILDDIKIELTDEFDRNFERKGFFADKWQPVKKEPRIGSLMMRTSYLRKSIQSVREGFRLVWRSSAPYADIHNAGGKIERVSKRGRAYTINMPKRQFIGTSPETDRIIAEIVDEHLPTGVNDFLNRLFNDT